MADKIFPDAKKLPVRKAANVRSDSKKLLRALIVLVLLMSFAAALVFGLVILRRVLFTSNPRFQLREIIVQSEGYWQDRSAQLASRLGIHTGDNLFSLDPGALRRQLEAIPNVQHCEVTRILPDTLKLRVVERIPRAALACFRGHWVIDEEGVVISRTESMMAGHRLPVILGVSDCDLEEGMRTEKFRPALDIIMQVARGFRDIEIRAIHIQDGGKVNMIMCFRGLRMCRVRIPADNNRNIKLLLTALQSAIIHAEQSRDRRGVFDLSFDGNVIIR